MKKIEAIIKPFKLNEVKDAIADVGAKGLMVLEIYVVNPAKEHSQRRAGTLYGGGSRSQDDKTPMMKIELVVTGEIANRCVDAIITAARTTTAGEDGIIFVTQVEEAIRIRTGETGELAV